MDKARMVFYWSAERDADDDEHLTTNQPTESFSLVL